MSEATRTSGGSGAAGRTSGAGLEDSIAGPLCYLAGLVTGILFLVLEKERRFVRFHSYQSIAFSVIWIVLSAATPLFGVVPIVGPLLGGLASLLVGLGGLALWLYLMWQAYRENEPELPWIGTWARSQVEGESRA